MNGVNFSSHTALNDAFCGSKNIYISEAVDVMEGFEVEIPKPWSREKSLQYLGFKIIDFSA